LKSFSICQFVNRVWKIPSSNMIQQVENNWYVSWVENIGGNYFSGPDMLLHYFLQESNEWDIVVLKFQQSQSQIYFTTGGLQPISSS
jgi:hypothetical protein